MSMTTTAQRILAVGLNPAWQKTLIFPQLLVGEVNRARSVSAGAGGKGVHVALAVNGAGGKATVLQFAGGSTGSCLTADLQSRGIDHCTVISQGATRTCTTLLSEHAPGVMTELIEPAAAVSSEEVAALWQQLEVQLTTAVAVTISGTCPPGIATSFYARIVQQARQRRCLTVVDAYQDGVDATLAAGVDLLKINAWELQQLSGEADCRRGARWCLQRGCQVVAVTAGQQPALLVTAAGAWLVPVPPLTAIVNPIGAGDTCTGVLVQELVAAGTEHWCREHVLVRAFQRAIAAASLSCLHPAAAVFDRADVERYAQAMAPETTRLDA